MKKNDTKRYTLVGWPDCQQLMESVDHDELMEGLVNTDDIPDDEDIDELDSAYLVPDGTCGFSSPEGDGYVRVPWPEAQQWAGKKDVLIVYDSTDVYVPERIYYRKTALLVSFRPQTRIVVDIPEGMTAERWLQDGANADTVARLARERMLEDAPNYLYGKNMSVEEDEECPYGTIPGEEEECEER